MILKMKRCQLFNDFEFSFFNARWRFYVMLRKFKTLGFTSNSQTNKNSCEIKTSGYQNKNEYS